MFVPLSFWCPSDARSDQHDKQNDGQEEQHGQSLSVRSIQTANNYSHKGNVSLNQNSAAKTQFTLAEECPFSAKIKHYSNTTKTLQQRSCSLCPSPDLWMRRRPAKADLLSKNKSQPVLSTLLGQQEMNNTSKTCNVRIYE